jgi:hypothetical protein
MDGCSTDYRESRIGLSLKRRAMMYRFLFAVAALAAFGLTPCADAADLAPRVKARTHVEATEGNCLRWVVQNSSWYNYCDPVRYGPRDRYSLIGWFGV